MSPVCAKFKLDFIICLHYGRSSGSCVPPVCLKSYCIKTWCSELSVQPHFVGIFALKGFVDSSVVMSARCVFPNLKCWITENNKTVYQAVGCSDRKTQFLPVFKRIPNLKPQSLHRKTLFHAQNPATEIVRRPRHAKNPCGWSLVRYTQEIG